MTNKMPALLNYGKTWKALFSNWVARGHSNNNARKKLENNHINAVKRLLPYVNKNIKNNVLNYWPYLGSRGLKNINLSRNAQRTRKYYSQERKKNNNITKALIIHTRAKPNNKNKPSGFPNKFPINELVRSLKSLQRK